MMKKKFREMTEDEKRVTKIALDGRQAEVDHLKLMVEYNTFMLDKMLKSNYLEKRRGFKKQNEDFKAEIEEHERIIEKTTTQMTEGIEIKGETGQGIKNMPGVE